MPLTTSLMLSSIAVFAGAWLLWTLVHSREQDTAWEDLQGRYPLRMVPSAPPVLRQSTGVIDGRKVRVRQVLGGTVVEVAVPDDLVLVPANADPDAEQPDNPDEAFHRTVTARGATWRIQGRARERARRAVEEGATLEAGWLTWPREGWAEDTGELLVHIEMALALARALEDETPPA